MGFLKFFKKKDPELAITEGMSLLDLTGNAVNIFELLAKHDNSLITKVVNEQIENQRLDGALIGNQGWYLPDAQNRLTKLIDDMKSGPISLDKKGNEMGLNGKRTFLALSDFADKINLDQPAFVRVKETLFLYSYMRQQWTDILSTLDFEQTNYFGNVLENVRIDSSHKPKLKELILKWVSVPQSIVLIGADGVLRLRSHIQEHISDEVNLSLEQNVVEITFEELATKFGISTSEIGELLQSLIDRKEIENVTIYPLDEKIVPRSIT